MNKFGNVILWIVRIVLPCAMVYGAIQFFEHLILTAPQQDRQDPAERAVTVETQIITRSNAVVRIQATGTVVPVEEVTLKARVSGEVEQINPRFEPGEIISQDEVILSIDRADYELALRQAQSALVQAEYEYKLELGYQQVARHEWELLENREDSSELERELTLRKPHLDKVKAGLESAQTALEQAELNLSRTEISLPFDALVLNRAVSVGTQVNTQSELGVFVDAALFRVDVTVPPDRLNWIDFPEHARQGAPVQIFASGELGGMAQWSGQVSKLVPTIESRGRMARVLIDVADPMRSDPPLLLNSFVSVIIEGRELSDIFVLPSKAVHNGDVVYVAGADSRIAFHTVKPIWRDSNWVFVRDGLENGDVIVATDVPAAVPGMLIKDVTQTTIYSQSSPSATEARRSAESEKL